MEKPIFVLGSFMRCGSTFLMRLLNTHPDIHIWGEHDCFFKFLPNMLQIYNTTELDDAELIKFKNTNEDGFYAHMNPPKDCFLESLRASLESYFKNNSIKYFNKYIWGFKEIAYSYEMIKCLIQLYPECTIFHLIRNPIDIAISLYRIGVDCNEVVLHSINHSRDICESYYYNIYNTNLKKNVHLIKYEELSNKFELLRKICSILNIKSDFDLTIFDRKIHSVDCNPYIDERKIITKYELPIEIKNLLNSKEIIETYKKYGYNTII